MPTGKVSFLWLKDIQLKHFDLFDDEIFRKLRLIADVGGAAKN